MESLGSNEISIMSQLIQRSKVCATRRTNQCELNRLRALSNSGSEAVCDQVNCTAPSPPPPGQAPCDARVTPLCPQANHARSAIDACCSTAAERADPDNQHCASRYISHHGPAGPHDDSDDNMGVVIGVVVAVVIVVGIALQVVGIPKSSGAKGPQSQPAAITVPQQIHRSGSMPSAPPPFAPHAEVRKTFPSALPKEPRIPRCNGVCMLRW